VRVIRGMHGDLPFAALGTGRPLIALAGLTPVAGIGGDAAVRMLVPGLTRLARWRRLTLFNRRRGLPEHVTIGDFAAEHAEALRSAFDQPVDLLGFSTGGSIAQQLAADHPDLVRRLVLVSTECRLGGDGKAAQAAIARHLRAGMPC